MSFMDMLQQRWRRGNFLCVGLDISYERLPSVLKTGDAVSEVIATFNREIIRATHDVVCCYKPNIAFYEGHGNEGMTALRATISFVRSEYPDIPVILDAKRGDIDSTNESYATSLFDDFRAHAVTVNPYLGRESLLPFLRRADRGIFVLVKTSNPGAEEFQDLPTEAGIPLHRVIARSVAETWNEAGNCAVVVGATYPQDIAGVRELIGEIPILIPGVGAQGGELAAAVRAGSSPGRSGIILNSSRSIVYASNGADFADAAGEAAKEMNEAINRHL
jgi:orotidine-5'-phosphate decarboxylase